MQILSGQPDTIANRTQVLGVMHADGFNNHAHCRQFQHLNHRNAIYKPVIYIRCIATALLS